MTRTALITGASRGIGAAIACRLAADGWDLTLSARSPDPLRTLADELRAEHGVRVHTAAGDMAEETDVRGVAEQHLAAYDRLDALVLSAGMGQAGAIADFPLHRLDKQYAVNLRAPFQLIQECLPALRATTALPVDHGGVHTGARIVAIASITGVTAEPSLAAYAATKAAVLSLCESVNVEESAAGVSACAVAPGYVDTDMTAWMHDRLAPEDMITAEDVAEIVSTVVRLSRTAVVPSVVLTRPGPRLWRA
ncbi:SDR family NAD(P)-dependent oxidoreductase [Streptomyces sp. NPDC050287]|uniref:SDR family NAD(P)-dependent oxidoreductase n=1 Tax=Streptomyces sp. NPDC050287 TaxID=3365608 RepID=UPI0037B322C8